MTKLTTERLEKFVNDIKTDGMCDITDHQVELALIRLLAYEQAAKNPVAWVATDSEGFPEYNGHNEFSSSCGAGTPLYAAPVLPKQPEHSRQHFESLCNQFWNWAELDEIDQDEEPRLEWNGSNYTHRVTAALWKMYQAAPAQPVIPEQNDLSEKLIGLANHIASAANGIPLGWQDWADEIVTDLRSLASTDQPVSEPYKLNGWISVDSELPEEGARVLAFSDGAFVLMTEFTGGEFYDVVRNGGELFETVTRCVTHWMPLPAAPTQESE